MSVIIGATGIVSKSLKKYVETIPPGQHSTDSLRKTVILGTSQKNVKQSRYTPWRRLGGEEVYIAPSHSRPRH
jgi:hypothetical protein